MLAGPTKLEHCEQNQLLIKKESISPTNEKPIYLFLISPPWLPGAAVGERGDVSPSAIPAASQGCAIKSSPPSPPAQHVMKKIYRGGQWHGEGSVLVGFCISTAWISL